MKKRFQLFTLAIVCLIMVSCNKDNIEYADEFNKSYKEWLTVKKESGNTYEYKVLRSSWNGILRETTIIVTDGEITQRSFSILNRENLPTEMIEEEPDWTENKREINSHKETSAFEAVSLDDIYDKARNEWLVKRENAKVYFQTENNGLISTCGYVEEGCMDDCFRGVNISNIKIK